MGNTGYFIYNDTEVKQPFRGRSGEVNPTAMWLRHYRNYVELTWMLGRMESAVEKMQVSKELGICERKLDYWYKMAGWNREEATRGAREVWNLWGITASQDRWLRR